MDMPRLPAINTESRYLLAKLAFGENVREKSFYMPLTSESNIKNNNITLKEGKDLYHQNNETPHCSISQTKTNNCNNDLENTSANDYSKEIQNLLTINLYKYNNTVSTSVLSKCLDRLKKVKSAAMWESFILIFYLYCWKQNIFESSISCNNSCTANNFGTPKK